MKLKNLVIATALLAGSTAGSVTAAVAADIEKCGSTQTCIWADNNYQNKLAYRTHGESIIKNLDAADEDKMDSYANNSNTYQTCAYSNRNGTGDEQDWEENEHNDNVSPLNSDEMSSWRTKYGC